MYLERNAFCSFEVAHLWHAKAAAAPPEHNENDEKSNDFVISIH